MTDPIFVELAEESPLWDEPGAVGDVVKLAWKLARNAPLDTDDIAILYLVQEAVISENHREELP